MTIEEKVKFNELIQKYRGIPYKLGSIDPEEGLDCLSFIWSFYRDMGKVLPTFFMGVDKETYAKVWEEDREEAKRLFIAYLRANLEEVEAYKQGDILVVEQGEKFIVGIYVQMGNILYADPRVGIVLLPLSSLRIDRMRIYRKEEEKEDG